IALIAGFTSFFAATMGLVSSDIKRVVAYSTISQLALMLAALGMASELGLFSGTFHLLSHSIFKALLFLAAGAVIHAVHTNNLDEMGGLRAKMPITFWTSAVGVLSLSGVPLFSGFWSKDLVIESTLQAGNLVVYLLITGASILTVAYSLRWLYKVFLAPPTEHTEHAHEAPPVMTIPLIILAAASVAIGVSGPMFEEQLHHYMGLHGKVSTSLTTYATSAAILAVGGGLGYIFYLGGVRRPEDVRSGPLGGMVHRILENRYYVDAFYYRVFVAGLEKAGAALLKFVELRVIDGFNYALSKATVAFVQLFRNIQTGESNVNISGLIIGMVLLIIILLRFFFGLT
ncbi:MAG: hypothetical protein NZ919_03825, partial [Candidatus Caldarchaeum sp.]|nr:hypothetical protein [Candidatus Caldarchaeum sp.]